MTERLADTIRFYKLLDRLATLVGGPRFLRSRHGKMDWPPRGVYFFCESGEARSGPGAERSSPVSNSAPGVAA